jgi:hypothetical protein
LPVNDKPRTLNERLADRRLNPSVGLQKAKAGPRRSAKCTAVKMSPCNVNGAKHSETSGKEPKQVHRAKMLVICGTKSRKNRQLWAELRTHDPAPRWCGQQDHWAKVRCS